MQRLLFWPVSLSFFFIFLFSCTEENMCDTQEFALPEIAILDPEDGNVLIPWGYYGPVYVSLELEAEAGLNTLKLQDPWDDYERDIHAFTDGEKSLEFTFQLDAYEGRNTFVLYDLCNQRSELEIWVVFEQDPGS